MPSELILYPRDGSLWDCVVRDATESDWEKFLGTLRGRQPGDVTFRVCGEVRPIPSDLRQLTAAVRAGPVLLAVRVDAIRLHFHCLDLPAMEFDLDPKEVTEAAEVALRLYLRALSKSLGHPIDVRPEGNRIVLETFWPT